MWKCSGCAYQFSVTAWTIFADRKRPIRDYLLAIAIFANGAKGHCALQLSRDLACQYKTAFVLLHKLREVIEAEQRKAELSGVCEVDGAYFGGHVKPKNEVAERVDRRTIEEQTGKRQVVVVMRQRKGSTLPVVTAKESDAIPAIRERVPLGSVGTACMTFMKCTASITRNCKCRVFAESPIKHLVAVRFYRGIQAALEKLAKADDRSLSYVINKILAEYLRARKLIK